MDTRVEYCSNCKEKVVHEIIDMRDGEDCWMVVIVKCSKCGNEKEIHLNC